MGICPRPSMGLACYASLLIPADVLDVVPAGAVLVENQLGVGGDVAGVRVKERVVGADALVSTLAFATESADRPPVGAEIGRASCRDRVLGECGVGLCK